VFFVSISLTINVIQSTQLINNNYPGIVSGSAVTVIEDT